MNCKACRPAYTLLFCLLVTVDAALQAGATQVTVILPTFPYSRQHKKKGRESLSAALPIMAEQFHAATSSPMWSETFLA